MVDILLEAAKAVFTVTNMGLIGLGAVTGIVVAAIPGLTGSMAIALLLPITFKLPIIASLCLLIGVYKGSQFGGAISAILIGVPGAPEASATLLDGHPLAKRGYPGKALKMGLYASVIADTTSDLYLVFLVGILAPFALLIGPAEKFALLVFALTLIGVITSGDPLRGLLSGLIGILLALIGLDPITGLPRFTFGQSNLIEGISLIPLMLGLFAVTTMIQQAVDRGRAGGAGAADPTGLEAEKKDDRLSGRELKGALWTILRSGTIGAFIGAVPGLGSGPAAFIAYSITKGRSKNPEEFGKGHLHGVAAAEAGNSGTVGATLLPVLCLGIPGSGIAALFMAALLIQGITPGPQIFVEHSVVAYGLFIALIVGNLFSWLCGELLLRIGRKIVQVNASILYPIVFLLCLIGTYGVAYRIFDIWVMLAIGVLGFLLQKFSVPIIPAVIGFVLGELTEQSLRQSLLIFDQDVWSFLSHPVVLVLFILSAASILYSVNQSLRMKKRKESQ